MADADSDRTIRQLECEIDNYYRVHPFFRLDRVTQRWYLATLHEETVRLPVLYQHEGETDGTYFLNRIEAAKGGLQHALRWTDQSANPGRVIPRSVDWHIYELARQFLEIGMDYWGIVAPFVLYSDGLVTAELHSPTEVAFFRDPKESPFDVLDYQLTSAGRGNMPHPRDLENPDRERLAVRIRSAKPRGRFGVSYSLQPRDLIQLAHRHAAYLIAESKLPTSWVIGGLERDTLLAFLAALRTLAQFHIECVNGASVMRGVTGFAPGSCLFARPVHEWVLITSRMACIDEALCRSLIALFTYVESDAKRDISLSPLLPIGGELMMPPYLVLLNDLERNALALLARRRTHEFDLASGGLESVMMDRLTRLANRMSWLHASHVVYSSSAVHGEIDFILSTRETTACLVCQLKFVIAPSEPREVIARIAREKEGIRQCQRFAGLPSKEQRRILASAINAEVPEKVVHCVIADGFTGSAASINSGIPCVALEHLELMAMSNSSLDAICDDLAAFRHLPVSGRDFTEVRRAHRFGRLVVDWEGTEITAITPPLTTRG